MCGVDITQYSKHSSTMDNSPSESSITLAAGNFPCGGSASSAVAQLLGNWAELQVDNGRMACFFLVAAAAIGTALPPSLSLALFMMGELNQYVDYRTECVKRYELI